MKIGVAKNKKKVFLSLFDKNIELHPLWLRERVKNQEHLDQNTGQRLYDPAKLSQKLKIKNALIKKKLLSVEFTDGIEFQYHLDELLEEINKNIPDNKLHLWNSKIKTKPVATYKNNFFNSKEGFKFLEKFYKYGFAILKHTKVKKNSIVKYANLLGVVRPTNFGVLFNVISVRKANDLAYTSYPLSAHTDNPYRKPIPGIQLLHCIKNNSQGGLSTLTDGFAVSEYIKKKYYNFFKILTKVKIRFTYMSKNTFLENWGETIELDQKGNLKRIRLSPRLDYVPMLKKNKLSEFYKARALFIKLCNSKKFMIKFKLSPGDLLIMDNYRTLHGRTSYDMKIGERHLQGCYIDHDSAESKLKYLKNKFKE